MAELFFILTVLSTIVLLIVIVIKLLRKKNINIPVKVLTTVLGIYMFLWILLYSLSKEQIVPLSTDICFDDWCATLVEYEKLDHIGSEKPQGQFIVLRIKMSNHARGRAQKPSEPRVNILDSKNSYVLSSSGQQAIEKNLGKQISLDTNLELNQSLETVIVFDVPINADNLRVFIDEGPLFMTTIIFSRDRQVFLIK